MKTTLDQAVALAKEERGLAVISTLRSDGSIHASLVNAGVVRHPVTGDEVLGFVTNGKVKLGNLRARPRATATFRRGYRWAAVEGRAEVLGPEDPHPGIEDGELPGLLREIFAAAGGTHDDWDEYDRVMAAEHRVAVLIHPEKIYTS